MGSELFPIAEQERCFRGVSDHRVELLSSSCAQICNAGGEMRNGKCVETPAGYQGFLLDNGSSRSLLGPYAYCSFELLVAR
jgi:hypothetical protein